MGWFVPLVGLLLVAGFILIGNRRNTACVRSQSGKFVDCRTPSVGIADSFSTGNESPFVCFADISPRQGNNPTVEP